MTTPRWQMGLVFAAGFAVAFGASLWWRHPVDPFQELIDLGPPPDAGVRPWPVDPPRRAPPRRDDVDGPTPGPAPPTAADDLGALMDADAPVVEGGDPAVVTPFPDLGLDQIQPAPDAPLRPREDVQAVLDEAHEALEDCMSAAWVGGGAMPMAGVDLELGPTGPGDRSQLAVLGLPDGFDAAVAVPCMTRALREHAFAFAPEREALFVTFDGR